MSDLTDFLLARLREDHEAERDELAFRGIPRGDWESARPIMRRTLFYALSDLRTEFHLIGWRIMAATFPRTARRVAASCADHPDYRQEWRP